MKNHQKIFSLPWLILNFSGQDKIADFEMKLMDIKSEHLGIPEAEYQSIVKMPSQEFARICKDLSSIGDTGTLFCSRWFLVLFLFYFNKRLELLKIWYYRYLRHVI